MPVYALLPLRLSGLADNGHVLRICVSSGRANAPSLQSAGELPKFLALDYTVHCSIKLISVCSDHPDGVLLSAKESTFWVRTN